MEKFSWKNMNISRVLERIWLRVHRGQGKLPSVPLETKPLWFDREDGEVRIQELQEPWIKDAVLSLRENGFALLAGNVKTDLCDRVMSEFNAYAASRPEATDYRDKWGLHERLANLHLVSPAARELAGHERILSLMSVLFQARPRIVGSLLFEKGSTQSIHRDTPAFFTNPLNNYFGVWTALQDITEDAGPLIYYPGGHRLVPDAELYRRGLDSDAYFQTIINACQEACLPLTQFFPKKGDTLIWHPQLPHGGGSRTNPAAARHSIVVHYMNSSADIYPPDEFFAGAETLMSRSAPKILSIGKIDALDHGKPQFFHNREEGNFDEF